MNIENFVNHRSLTETSVLQTILPLLVICLIVLTHFAVFVYAPSEQVMGPVQRIFYFHVSFALSAYIMVAILFLGSIFYLVERKVGWDLVTRASASVAFMLCSLVLVSGMIWGHSAWNTWWRWEPRLVSFLILWLILFSYTVLRTYTEDDHRQASFASVLGILAAVNVPIIMVSIQFLDRSQQLHPKVIADQGLQDLRYVHTFICSLISIISLSLWLFILRLTNLTLAEKIKFLLRH